MESGAISSNNNWSNNSGWDVHGIAVELDQVLAMDHAGLGREDRSRDNPGDGDLGSRDWEEQVEWVGNADVAEEDLLGWQNNLQVEGWDTLLEDHLSGGLVTARFKLDVLNGAEKIFNASLLELLFKF